MAVLGAPTSVPGEIRFNSIASFKNRQTQSSYKSCEAENANREIVESIAPRANGRLRARIVDPVEGQGLEVRR
ncbi:MAG TPA: hypothetical protein VFN53_03615 [Acidobacteriaceae bacterium]|nr:hypothetical protein [Acidobacteriaceae bacterium]